MDATASPWPKGPHPPARKGRRAFKLVLSEHEDDLMRNFLSLQGGLWEENLEFRVHDLFLPPFPIEALPKELGSKAETTTRIPTTLDRNHAHVLRMLQRHELLRVPLFKTSRRFTNSTLHQPCSPSPHVSSKWCLVNLLCSQR
jgi:hypothetical protein